MILQEDEYCDFIKIYLCLIKQWLSYLVHIERAQHFYNYSIYYRNMNYDLESLATLFKNGTPIIGWFKGHHINSPFEINAHKFVQLAENDLISNNSINALSNIKRAISCQLDSVLFSLGLLKTTKKEKWNFPDKIEFFNKLGIISPRVLKKINQKRNFLEHEYTNPDPEDIENFLDVAMLFIAYTDNFISTLITEAKLYSQDKANVFVVKLDYVNEKIIFLETLDGKNSFESSNFNVIKKEITSDSDEYNTYLYLLIRLHR